jgi:two-component system sensor histidine kinase PilS (NtrC family)
VFSGVLYVALVSSQYGGTAAAGWLATASDLPTRRVAAYTVAFNLSGFLAVALLAGSLAERARSAGARLADASTAIEDLRAFNDYVINSLLSGLATTDDACRILTFNRAAASITGAPVRDAIGADARDVLQLPEALRARLHRIDAQRGLRIDVEYRRADGRMIEIGLTAAPLVLPDGRDGFLFTFQDVTSVRRLEREARLRQRLAAVGEMAAGIAHEIRNPLAAMAGSIQVLREELPLTEEQSQLMDIVLRESDRLNNTIRSFLAYAKPPRLTASRLDVAAIVTDAARLLRNSADVSASHVVDVDVPSQPVWCDADENQLRQIVWNLATNGLRAMTNGGTLRLSVCVADDAASSEVVLAVADEGCGIPADQLDRIFQPFHSSFRKGTGLGLAIVHRIVSEHGGTIQVSSTVGVGTTIQVRLPIDSSATAAEQEVA